MAAAEAGREYTQGQFYPGQARLLVLILDLVGRRCDGRIFCLAATKNPLQIWRSVL
jgi:hypothetical protein